ncbi:MAG: ABC transporter permease [Lachnospiraceae bacterium]|nr:ABC transporter permease [Lachnospiraceae bacterium]
MKSIGASFRRFRRKPAFTGFILFLVVLLLNIIVQGWSQCLSRGFSIGNALAFFQPSSLNSIFMSNMPFILVTIGQALLLLVGQMDVSIGVQIALVNVVCIMVPQQTGCPVWVGWLVGFAAAFAISALAGVCCSVLRLPSLLATYAMTFLVQGINVLIMNVPQGAVPRAYWKPYQSTVYGLFENPPSFLKFLDYIPVAALVLIAVLLIWHFFARKPFGKHIYAVGTNQRNAFAAGINPVSTQMKAFLIKGFFVGVAGICLTLMSASGNPLQCEEYGIKSLSAAIIGGMGWGGWGSISCGVFGGGFLVLIQNAVYYFFTLLSKLFNGFAVTSYWHNFVSDIIIFGGLLMTLVTAREQRKTLQQGLKSQFKRGEKNVK